MRLVGGTSNQIGRFEIEFNGNWGSVCFDYGMTERERRVVCRSLGLPHRKSKPLEVGTFETAASDAPLWFTIEHCSGLEESILDCDLSPWSGRSCPSGTDLGVMCVDHGRYIIIIFKSALSPVGHICSLDVVLHACRNYGRPVSGLYQGVLSAGGILRTLNRNAYFIPRFFRSGKNKTQRFSAYLEQNAVVLPVQSKNRLRCLLMDFNIFYAFQSIRILP